jgi:hypothetical protein
MVKRIAAAEVDRGQFRFTAPWHIRRHPPLFKGAGANKGTGANKYRPESGNGFCENIMLKQRVEIMIRPGHIGS